SRDAARTFEAALQALRHPTLRFANARRSLFLTGFYRSLTADVSFFDDATAVRKVPIGLCRWTSRTVLRSLLDSARATAGVRTVLRTVWRLLSRRLRRSGL